MAVSPHHESLHQVFQQEEAVEIWRQLMSTMEIFYRSAAAQQVREEGR